jgi:outer membrane receptor for ferrienterochelin and colicins
MRGTRAAFLVLFLASTLTRTAFAEPSDTDAGPSSPESGEVETPTGSEEAAFEPEPELVERISVGTKATERTQLSPAVVSVISADQIASRGYRSIGEALQDVAGLYVSNDLQNMHVSVRGLSGGARGDSRYLKVMIDGRPFSFGYTQGYFLGPEFIPMSAVERIEIMKGPASALYGAGALVGAINVVTRRPPAEEGQGLTGTTRALASSAYGARRVAGLDASQTLQTQDFFVLLALQYSYENRSGLVPKADSPFLVRDANGQLPVRFRGDGNGVRPSANDEARPAALLAKLQLDLGGGRADLTFAGQLHDAQAEFHDLSVLTRGTKINLYNWMGNLSYERPFESGVSIAGGVGYGAGGTRPGDQFDLGRQDLFVLTRRFSYSELNAFVEGKYETASGGRFLVGVDGLLGDVKPPVYFEVSRANNAETARATPGAESVRNMAVYGQVVYPIIKALRLAGGVRFDDHNVYGGALGARGGVVVAASDTLSFKLLAGRSYKGPSPEQLFGVAMNALDVRGDRTLKPQYMHGADAVIDWFAASWANINLTGFVNEYSDALAYVNEAGNLRPVAFDASTVGGELTVRFAKELGDYGLSVAPYGSAASVKVPTRLAGGVASKVIPDNEATPVVMAGLRAHVRLDPIWIRPFVLYRHGGTRAPTQSNLVANQTPDNRAPAYMLDSYQIVDLGVSSKPIPLLDKVKLEGILKVTNLLDSTYKEVGYNGVDVPSLGRTGWLQARLVVE